MESIKKPLIILMVVALIVDVLFSIYGVVQINNEVNSDEIAMNKELSADLEATETSSKITLIVLCVISILLHLMGIFGAYTEHFCLTLTYAIFMTLGTLGCINQALNFPVRWLVFILWFSTTVLSYAFCRDIKRTKGNADCCCCTC